MTLVVKGCDDTQVIMMIRLAGSRAGEDSYHLDDTHGRRHETLHSQLGGIRKRRVGSMQRRTWPAIVPSVWDGSEQSYLLRTVHAQGSHRKTEVA